MATKIEPTTAATTRIVIEPHSQFDLSTHSRTTTVRSLAITTLSNNRTILYVGTHSGTLFSLSPNLNHANSSQNGTVLQKLSFLRSVSVTNSSVDAVLVLPDLEKVLILSDGSLFLVDSDLSNRAVRLGFSKGISVVTRRRMRNNESEGLGLGVGLGLDSSNHKFLHKLGGFIVKDGGESHSEGFGGCVLAIAIGKRLVIVELVVKDVNNASLVVLKEIQCVDGVVSTMVWIDDSIVVGTANGYSLISCVSGQSSVIFSLPDVSRPPRLKLLYRDWRVLLLVDNVGIIVDEKGQPVGGSLVFRHGLDSVGELSFYVVVVSDGKIELYNKKHGGCVQVLPFGGEGIGPCVVASEEDRGGKLVAVATATKILPLSLIISPLPNAIAVAINL
ncbi:hypothetical protein TSUD_355090 [Trifolium subterraneum]|uniref:CNH domain-containing protein n=1 Tax=Trifolium subterraneum TaxID=3900 RepID=A0A2Z6MM20_TRISU|nr:hypothetical protein TSUD_355090 [Trifolium subterraneum]